MRIAIDLTSLSFHMSGIERYAMGITEELIQQDVRNEYILIFRNEIYSSFYKYIDSVRVKSVVLQGKSKLLFNQLILPFYLYKIGADKYFFFAFTSPILFFKKGIINTIHDMGAWDSPESMTFFQKLYWRVSYRVASLVSCKIITVSNFSKDRINSILHFPRHKICVAYSAVYNKLVKDNRYSFQDIKEMYSLPNKYVMTLSTIEPRKNIELLIKSYISVQDKVDYDLVLIGRKGWKVEHLLGKYNSNRIHFTGFVDDDYISTIYRHAECFVFPSKYEGFGLPPIEALSLGTPVIASDAGSIPEILRRQAVYFESNNKDELQKLLINFERNLLPCELDNFQKRNYTFKVSANKILSIIYG